MPSTPAAAFLLRERNAASSASTVSRWNNAVNRSFFRCFAASRTRDSLCDMLSRLCVRRMCGCSAFPLAPLLRSTDSAPFGLFACFAATMSESDFSSPYITGYDSSSSRCGPSPTLADGQREISRFPRRDRIDMPGSQTPPGPCGTRSIAPYDVAFR